MIVNGQEIHLSKKQSLLEFLNQKNYSPSKIAVECNGVIVPKSQYSATFLTEADTLEIVSFVGGG